MKTHAFRLGTIAVTLVAGTFLGCNGSRLTSDPSRGVAYGPQLNYDSAHGGRATAQSPRAQCAPDGTRRRNTPRQTRPRNTRTGGYAAPGSEIRTASARSSRSSRSASGAGYAATGRMPVDLPTVMRLVSGRNLDVTMVRQELREAHAELRYAKRWWLPNVSPTLRYNDANGNEQNTQGAIFDVNKTNAFGGAGVYGDWEVGESIFTALAAKRRTSARQEAVTAGLNDATLEAALAYFELLRNQMALGIAAEILQLYEGLVKETEAQVKAGGGFRGDELRARARRSHAKVRQRKADGQVRISAAKLREVLNLPSDVDLYAAEGQVARLEFVPVQWTQDELLRQAMASRPELREAKMRRAAAHEDRRLTTVGPWIPNVRAGYEVGGFGTNFNNLGDTENFGVGLSWTIGRDGIGGRSRQRAAVSRERQWVIRQRKIQQKVVREVAEAQAEAQASDEAIEAAQVGVVDAKEALSLYAKRVQIGVGIPLDAIVAAEVLNDAQLDYLDAVVGFNKAQMKLLRAVGRRPDQVVPKENQAPDVVQDLVVPPGGADFPPAGPGGQAAPPGGG